MSGVWGSRHRSSEGMTGRQGYLVTGLVILLMEEIRRSPVELGSLSHYLQGFIRSRWCRISSINSILENELTILCPIPAEIFPGSPNTTNVSLDDPCKKILILKWERYSPKGLPAYWNLHSVILYREVSHNQNKCFNTYILEVAKTLVQSGRYSMIF